ncbi:MAG: thioredoxin family protein [Acidobacteriaceae bacterium]|nr:thioredoxin family protein [Acidobacteriaceae bacterium]
MSIRSLRHFGTALLCATLGLSALTAQAAPPAPTAKEILATALQQAQQQHKNVLLVFSASWCGPCHLYERFLEDPQMKSITEKAFVVARVDVGERPGDPRHTDTPGGTALRSSLGSSPEPGFPFLVITSQAGQPLINSNLNGKLGDNIGYPMLPREIDWYIAMLKQAAPALSADDIAAQQAWLKAHAH